MDWRCSTDVRHRISIVVVLSCAIVASWNECSCEEGPESVTISGPGIDEPIELINSSLVGELMQQTGLWSASGDAVPTSPPPIDDLGSAYMLTWINSGPPTDPVANRTIRQLLYFDASHGPLIHTPDQRGGRRLGRLRKGLVRSSEPGSLARGNWSAHRWPGRFEHIQGACGPRLNRFVRWTPCRRPTAQPHELELAPDIVPVHWLSSFGSS